MFYTYTYLVQIIVLSSITKKEEIESAFSYLSWFVCLITTLASFYIILRCVGLIKEWHTTVINPSKRTKDDTLCSFFCFPCSRTHIIKRSLAVKKCGKFNQVRETPYTLCTLSYAHLRETPLCGCWHFYAWRGLEKWLGWGPYRLDYLP
jgi:hypothetical protein